MRREKRIIYIEASDGKEFEALINEKMRGLVNPQLQVFGKYQGAIIFTEIYIEEEQKTIADLFEEAGCGATCSECPQYKKPTDGRQKWTVCGNRRVRGESRACDSYYLGRRKNVSGIRAEDDGERMEDKGTVGLFETWMDEGIQQESRQDQLC